MIKESKLKKHLFYVEFMYVKGDAPEMLRFTESFYETRTSLENCIDTVERIMIRLGHSLLAARIIKQS